VGQARRRTQRLAELFARSCTISPHEAARLLCERTHIVTVAGNDRTISGNLLEALAMTVGSQLRVLFVHPSYDPRQPRPTFRLYDPRLPGHHYPPATIGFLPDTAEHRRIIDAIICLLTARQPAMRSGPSVSTFGESGPIIFIDPDEVNEGASLALEGLRELHLGRTEDLSLN
jgi:hypothetical protein